MKYSRIYHFKRYLTLTLLFLILCYGILAGGIVLMIVKGLDWHIFLIVLFGLYTIYSTFFLYKSLILRFKKEIKAEGKFIESVLYYQDEPFGPYIKIGAEPIPLLGFYTKGLRKKIQEGTKIAAYYIQDEQTAILLEQKIR